VTVDENVRLEVLDWGGTGRPIVLLTGAGDTAHIFDDFALKLTRNGHVYGITRRGSGESSAPASGYGADRLGDDVLAVLDSLKINRPILVGHSVAGSEMSSIGSRHPERVAGLVYLDALLSYAYTTPQELKLRSTLEKLQNDLQAMTSRPPDPFGIPRPPDLLTAVLNAISEVQQQLSALPRSIPPPPPSASPTSADLASYAALNAFLVRTRGFGTPEAELRQKAPPTPEGRPGPRRAVQRSLPAIMSGWQSFVDIHVPALALCAPTEFLAANPLKEARQAAFERNVSGARVVRFPGAHHYIFMSNEAEVLREVVTFVGSLR
jgi:pimeloyl-ACP methyl ester carboxylesterase